MSHVSEPWKLEDMRLRRADGPLFALILPEQHGRVIADIWNVDPDKNGLGTADPWGGVTTDTAQLLVTAPKLLNALRAFVKKMDAHDIGGYTYGEQVVKGFAEEIALAKTVIAEVEDQ